MRLLNMLSQVMRFLETWNSGSWRYLYGKTKLFRVFMNPNMLSPLFQSSLKERTP